MVEIRPSLPGDTWLMLPTVRQSDIDELAAIGHTPEECLRHGILASEQVATVIIDGEPAGIVGIMNDQGYRVVWACFTTTIERRPIPFLRACRRWLQDKGPLLNFVDTRNTMTIRWLSWLGFTIDAPIPYGVNGEPFHCFWRI